jgi:hypothetical protein
MQHIRGVAKQLIAGLPRCACARKILDRRATVSSTGETVFAGIRTASPCSQGTFGPKSVTPIASGEPRVLLIYSECRSNFLFQLGAASHNAEELRRGPLVRDASIGRAGMRSDQRRHAGVPTELAERSRDTSTFPLGHNGQPLVSCVRLGDCGGSLSSSVGAK